MKRILLLIHLILFTAFAYSQKGTITGTVTDARTGETLVGCNVVIQGTTTGTITDLNGRFKLENRTPGDYNLVISYISYDRQTVRVTVPASGEAHIDVALQPASEAIEDVKVIAHRRSNTESSMIASIKASNIATSGISSQQISKSEDKDASEVVRRIPGVTIRDGKFIIVRGLIERYNTVWLNGASTPSSDPDIRAFSFDVIPASAIDHILIYKTPAPELPADFAGGAIQIFTQTNADENSFKIGYATGYNNQTTFRNFQTYKGGKYDWLGIDDGTRALPVGFPADLSNIEDNPTPADVAMVNKLGKSFNKIWTYSPVNAAPNQSFIATLKHRFLLGHASLVNITAVNYSSDFETSRPYKAAYDGYDVRQDTPYFRHQFDDTRFARSVRAGALMNWVLVFGNNQRIEFSNLFNQSGLNRTSLREGYDKASSIRVKQYELFFQSRSTYTGQLRGSHNFSDMASHFDWTLGYSYANRNQPDTRRVTEARDMGADPSAPYYFQLSNFPDPRLLGRLYIYNNEKIYNFAGNFDHTFDLNGFKPQVKAGVYLERRSRDFRARNIGYVLANFSNYQLLIPPIDSIMQDKNIDFYSGLRVAENTGKTDSYKARNVLNAGYAAVKLPMDRFTVYTGVRIENNDQQLSLFQSTRPSFERKKTDLFPSANITYHFNPKTLLRAAYGRSVNRPEFREISPFIYYDFEQYASVYGDTLLKNCYIDNYDLRLEYYPSPGQMISFGGFYKNFDNTIEAQLFNNGSDLNYRFHNTLHAKSLGLELDVRKNFAGLTGAGNITSVLRDLTVIFNASWIYSQVKDTAADAREGARPMQGQSPYIVNGGLYWHNTRHRIDATVMYNVIGKRIAYVGDTQIPHTWELPRNSLDLTFMKEVGKYLEIKAGVKNLLNEPVSFVQDYDFTQNPGQKQIRQVDYRTYATGTVFKLGLSFIF